MKATHIYAQQIERFDVLDTVSNLSEFYRFLFKHLESQIIKEAEKRNVYVGQITAFRWGDNVLDGEEKRVIGKIFAVSAPISEIDADSNLDIQLEDGL